MNIFNLNKYLLSRVNEKSNSASLMNALFVAFVFCMQPSTALAAALNDIEAVPHLDSAGKQGYREFLAAEFHRAFVIAPGGGWFWKAGESEAESAIENALQACLESTGKVCLPYAENDKVVFDEKSWARLWGPYQNRAEAAQAYTGKERGDRFFNLAFKSAAGKPMKLSDLKGKVTLLHFWGSWCPSCLREMPELQALHRALGSSPDIQMVLLQVREKFDAGRQWAKQQQLDVPLYDSSSAADKLTLAGGKVIHDREIASAFPTTYILDKHGIVVFSHVGSVSGWLQYLPLLRDVAERSGK